MSAESNPIVALSEQFSAIQAENADLRESLDEVRAMFRREDAGWALIGAYAAGDRHEGLELDELKEISEKIRPHVAGDALPGRAARLDAGYVWSKGLHIEGVEDRKSAGAKSNLKKFFDNAVNQESIFSSDAQAELQRARFTDGNIFLLCDTATRTVRRIPLSQIVAVRINPEFPEEVYAYKRQWDDPRPNATKPLTKWYYTNRFDGTKQKSFTEGGDTVAVAQGAVIVDLRFNRQVGWPLGIPDAVPGMVWAAAYTEIMNYGRVVNESLAKILYKVIAKSKSQGQTAGVKISGATGAGNTAVMTEGADLQAVSTAGKGYDFKMAYPVAAMAATSWDVPVMEILSDVSTGSGSYGAAQTLTTSVKNSKRLMQASWLDMYRQVLAVFGITAPRIWFDPIEDPDPYREAQRIKILSDALSDEEYRAQVLDTLDIAGNPTEIPPLLARRSEEPETTTPSTDGIQAASPGQGQSNGSGGASSGDRNDLRSDTISQSIMQDIQNEQFLERLESLVTRMENAAK